MSQVTSESILTTKTIVEQAIKDYHAQILPYLNGSFPTPIANKFDKANLYSTDEQIVGRWIDGKPVYQKSYFKGDLGGGENVIEANFSANNSVEHVLKIDAIMSNSTNSGYIALDNNSSVNQYVLVNETGSLIFMKSTTGSSTWEITITIQYTKTTDTAMEIGSDTDYSTTEKIIGTWIDGKPLYQKSYELQNFVKDGLYHIIDSTMTNISVKKREMTNNTWFKSPSDYSGFIVTDVDSSGLKLMYCGSYSGTANFVITLKYTKTTD